MGTLRKGLQKVYRALSVISENQITFRKNFTTTQILSITEIQKISKSSPLPPDTGKSNRFGLPFPVTAGFKQALLYSFTVTLIFLLTPFRARTYIVHFPRFFALILPVSVTVAIVSSEDT